MRFRYFHAIWNKNINHFVTASFWHFWNKLNYRQIWIYKIFQKPYFGFTPDARFFFALINFVMLTNFDRSRRFLKFSLWVRFSHIISAKIRSCWADDSWLYVVGNKLTSFINLFISTEHEIIWRLNLDLVNYLSIKRYNIGMNLIISVAIKVQGQCWQFFDGEIL